MYYHSRKLQYVRYGKVGPAPLETLDPDFSLAYQWLGQYCGFYPQVWLARSQTRITGFRPWNFKKQLHQDKVLFAFDTIQGFPLAYDFWEQILVSVWNQKTLRYANRNIRRIIRENALDPNFLHDPVSITWHETRNIQEVFSKHLFVKHDQVVVPLLNLKAAKQIICRNEHQKKKLRQMGFIEDRIIIRGHRPIKRKRVCEELAN